MVAAVARPPGSEIQAGAGGVELAFCLPSVETGVTTVNCVARRYQTPPRQCREAGQPQHLREGQDSQSLMTPLQFELLQQAESPSWLVDFVVQVAAP